MSLASSRKASPRVHPSILPIHDAIPGVVLSSDSSPDSLMRIVSTPKGGFGTFDRMEPKSREFTLTSLVRLISDRDVLGFDGLEKIYGGSKGLAKALQCNLKSGLEMKYIPTSEYYYGKNVIKAPEQLSLLALMWSALHDTVLIILMIAGVISLLLGIFVGEDPSVDWIEGVAILFAVQVVVFVAGMTEKQKQKQFLALEKGQSAVKTVEVIRGGETMRINVAEVVVGDLLKLQGGAIACADGILVERNAGSFTMDESALTGESRDIHKNLHENPFVLSGSCVKLGEGKMVVTCVGLFSEEGIIQKIITGVGAAESKVLLDREFEFLQRSMASQKLEITTSDSPSVDPGVKTKKTSVTDESGDKKKASLLVNKLGKMALQIGVIGTIMATFVLLVLIIRYIVEYFGIDHKSYNSEIWTRMVHFLIIAVTVLVVSIPEGLPLAVTISLAFSVAEMQLDHCLVKTLASCETMGNATTICSDKTGTLTSNRMTVVRAWIGGLDFQGHGITFKITNDVSAAVRSIITTHIAFNCGADSFYKFDGLANNLPIQNGNKSDCAIMLFADNIGDFKCINLKADMHLKVIVFPFNSSRKRSTCIMELPNGKWRVLVKGAAEVVLTLCNRMLMADGSVNAISEADKEIMCQTVINAYADKALRVLLMCYKDLATEPQCIDDEDILLNSELIVNIFVGIQDPVRDEVPDAVKSCQEAGVTVRMLTGDNMITARAIAYKCGILVEDQQMEEYTIMEGPTFRHLVLGNDNVLNWTAMEPICKQVRVMGRCSPQDKYHLVQGLRHFGEIVAVTGDGTNDGPALREADVGFAMGITGTAIAKRAADIVITNDSFAAIVKAISWGRNVYDSISKFLVFQLTVNVVAIGVAVVGSIVLNESPMGAVQLLWVNMIMDSFASLALATEKPTPELLKRKPYDRNKKIITPFMFRNIICHGLYQLAVCFTIIWAGEVIWNIPNGRGVSYKAKASQHYTILFNAFVFLQIFNEINARAIYNETNVLKGFFKNKIFVSVVVGSCIGQCLIVEFGGTAFKTTPLTWNQWISCVIIGLSELPVHYIITKLYPMWLIPKYFADGSMPSTVPSKGGANDTKKTTNDNEAVIEINMQPPALSDSRLEGNHKNDILEIGSQPRSSSVSFAVMSVKRGVRNSINPTREVEMSSFLRRDSVSDSIVIKNPRNSMRKMLSPVVDLHSKA